MIARPHLFCRSNVSSGKVHEMKDHLDYIVEVLLHYTDNEDIATAALGLIEAIYSLGSYVILNNLCTTTFLLFCLELSILYESEGSHRQSGRDLKCSDVLPLTTQLLERFIELADVQLYGFNCLSYIFTLSKVNVSGCVLFVILHD